MRPQTPRAPATARRTALRIAAQLLHEAAVSDNLELLLGPGEPRWKMQGELEMIARELSHRAEGPHP